MFAHFSCPNICLAGAEVKCKIFGIPGFQVNLSRATYMMVFMIRIHARDEVYHGLLEGKCSSL